MNAVSLSPMLNRVVSILFLTYIAVSSAFFLSWR